jgi:uncharacterized protein YdeI (YjbR/CyaY-like superfamily)
VKCEPTLQYHLLMPTTDPRVDAYIAKSADFAKSILNHLRGIVHEACPDVVETFKWSNPSFDHRGVMCSMGAFKEHCTFGFWKGELLGLTRVEGTQGHFGRITSITDLPSRAALVKLVKRAAKLNEEGIKEKRSRPAARPEAAVPDDLLRALKKNKKALTAFEAFPPSHRREYIQWITDAQREETRQRRLDVAIAQIAEGKPQNWKYMK